MKGQLSFECKPNNFILSVNQITSSLVYWADCSYLSVINSNYPLFLRFNSGDVLCPIHTISFIICRGRRILRVHSVHAHYLYIVCECSLFSVQTPVDLSEYKVSHTKLDSRVIKNPCERVTCNLYSGRMITWRPYLCW